MLVLSRKKNESIVITTISPSPWFEIRGDKVRLGIVAPKEVPVHRQEVFDAIHGKANAEPAPSTVVVKACRVTIEGITNLFSFARDAKEKEGFLCAPRRAY